MPSKMRPDDWDRLFAPGAPRRGGPLRAFTNILLLFLTVGVLGGGSWYAFNYITTQREIASQNALIAAQTAAPLQTSTAQAAALATATRFAIRTATAVARLTPLAASTPQGTPEPTLGIGVVTRGGNLRSEPLVADTTVIGLIWPGDEVNFLEQRQVDGQVWFRVRLTRPAADRGGDGVASGRDGWASALLLSQPTPIPAP